MLDPARPDAGFVALVTIRLTRPEARDELLDLLVREVEDWVRHRPGFLSANYHVSKDGSRLVNYAQWASEDAYRGSFRDNPGSGSLRDAILAVDGVEDLEMVGCALVRSVVAAPAPSPAPASTPSPS
jgi:C-6 monooxygenase